MINYDSRRREVKMICEQNCITLCIKMVMYNNGVQNVYNWKTYSIHNNVENFKYKMNVAMSNSLSMFCAGVSLYIIL